MSLDFFVTYVLDFYSGLFFADFLWTSKESQSVVGPRPDDLKGLVCYVLLEKQQNMS